MSARLGSWLCGRRTRRRHGRRNRGTCVCGDVRRNDRRAAREYPSAHLDGRGDLLGADAAARAWKMLSGRIVFSVEGTRMTRRFSARLR